MSHYYSSQIMSRLQKRFECLYGARGQQCIERLAMIIGRYGIGFDLSQPPSKWNESTSILITYGDMVNASDCTPLTALKRFADKHFICAFSTIHLLPFFPYSSDDGFSVIHFRTVNPELGTWDDVEKLGKHFRLMFDLVLNHVSRRSGWFKDYEVNIAPGCDYFIEVDPSADLSAVVRPRSTSVLTPVNTAAGLRHVWTTFSTDQIDLNYSNPDVLFEMLDILLFYISMGARVIRMDAIAYLWKKVGTSCIHLPETHEVVKIFRDVIEMVAPDVYLLTETNVPHHENISYFGDSDEANLVYQFSLPPLLLHALLKGNARYLTKWASSLVEPPSDCAFLNFTASHDGIGIRPLEGLLPDEEIQNMLQQMHKFGCRVSTRRDPTGKDKPYELNITYFDALSFSEGSNQKFHVDRFLCSQAIAMAMKGIPAVYFNSLVAASNDYVLAEQTGNARALNRTKWDESELDAKLSDPNTCASQVFNRYLRLLRIRSQHPSFHPDAEQRVLDLGDAVFAIERTAMDQSEKILAISNVTASDVTIQGKKLADAGFDAASGTNLINGQRKAHSDENLLLKPYETAWICFS